MSPEKKKQRRCDLLTTIALFLGLVFTCRLWPLLLLMMLGVFTYAIRALVENERQRAVPSPPPLLALPAPISEQELISNAFGLLQRRITEELTRDFPRAKWVWGQTGARLCFAAGDDLVILLADAEGDEKTGVQIVAKALEEPIRQIAANAGLDGSVILEKVRTSGKNGYGFDAYKEEYCDMIASGIVDPAKVTRSALENAASVSGMVLTTESLVANKPQPAAPAAPAPDMGGMGGMY